ncbi:MAG TPA: SET domain-containing protein-lysine N-methyltransferase [Longimicrobiales bacterium]|nr:SET domain-containing protein-lysine N-methyltransferase [Longimicrobiales bacterium]
MATKHATRNGARRGRPLKMVDSRIHGRGVIATRDIAAGERLVEYVGEIITPGEADRRYPFDETQPHHTFLFAVNSRKIIDAAHHGNVARWINHSCDPNCEALVEKGRVFIYALRDIKKGEELVYDYWFVLDEPHTTKVKAQYPCRCGSKKCRGTILADRRKARAYLGLK